jgi:hypothetical protein
METATIVTLGNRTTPTPTSFEEAFGEFSEARGRGRARRQKRRMERIENRKTRRTARQQGRLEKKRSRVEARTQRRTMRADNREQRRAQKSEGKRSRERADLEQEREFAPQEEPQGDSGYAPQEGGYDDGGYAPQGDSGYAPQGGGYDDGGYAPQGDSGYAPQGGGYEQEQGGYEEQGGYDDGGYEGGSDDGGYDEGGYDEGGYDEGGYDDANYDGFDGVIENGKEMIDVPYSPQVNQNVADAAKRIEWNLELASRLKEKAKTNPSGNIMDAITKCQNRVKELESSMVGYCSFEGDFTSDAEGKMQYCVRRGGKRLASPEVRKRRREIMLAKIAARKERNAVRKRNGLTPVQSVLNPQISNQRIEIPAKELGSSATGIIGLDNAMDYDATATEIKLGADGMTSKIPFKTIAIGIAVGALGVFLLKKYKVI